jgi:Nickel responsive protein SCO4226-like
MKQNFFLLLCLILVSFCDSYAQNQSTSNNLYIDVHYLPAGKVNFADVAAAHAKDLATENKYGAKFIKYWVDESKGVVYCLSSAPDTAAISNTHREAHGLMPQAIYKVEDGNEASAEKGKSYFLDIHQLGANKVTASDVEAAHKKDLAVQKKYGVNFINYWVDERSGTVLCLSQAKDSSNVIQTHKEAHGLVPVSIELVKQGQ